MSSVSNKKWLQDIDVYDPDLDELLQEFKIGQQSDLKNLKQTEWEEIWRRAFVERVKSIKETTARQRLEKKLKKLEKIWRKESGAKTTSITKHSGAASSDAQSQNVADNAESKLYEQAPELKDYMRKNQIFDKHLFEILVEQGIKSEEDLTVKIDSKTKLDEILQQAMVKRTADIKDMQSRQRLEKTLTKFGKIVRSKNEKLKETSIVDDEKQLKTWQSDKEQQIAESESKVIKEWLQKENIFMKELLEGLVNNGVISPFQIELLEESEFDEIVRQVRVERLSNVKDLTARQNVDKILIKFEKIWRKESGVKKTSITQNTYK